MYIPIGLLEPDYAAHENCSVDWCAFDIAFTAGTAEVRIVRSLGAYLHQSFAVYSIKAVRSERS